MTAEKVLMCGNEALEKWAAASVTVDWSASGRRIYSETLVNEKIHV